MPAIGELSIANDLLADSASSNLDRNTSSLLRERAEHPYGGSRNRLAEDAQQLAAVAALNLKAARWSLPDLVRSRPIR